MTTTETTFDFGNGPVPAHRHPNGGGWVADSAHVKDSAYVGPDATVCDKAYVCDKARIRGKARVEGFARVHGYVQGNATVRGRAYVGPHAVVDGSAIVEGDALLLEHALATGDAVVGDVCLDGHSYVTVPISNPKELARGTAGIYHWTLTPDYLRFAGVSMSRAMWEKDVEAGCEGFGDDAPYCAATVRALLSLPVPIRD